MSTSFRTPLTPTQSLLILSSHHSGLILLITPTSTHCEAFLHFRPIIPTDVESGAEMLSRDIISSSEVLNLGEEHVIQECRVWWNLLSEPRDIILDAIIRCGLCCMDDSELQYRRIRVQPLPWPRWLKRADEKSEDFDEVWRRNEEVRQNEALRRQQSKSTGQQHAAESPLVYHVPASSDGSVKQRFIHLTRERRMEPFEILFDVESGRSLAHLLLDTILQCPIDARTQVVSNIVIAGFLVDVPGFKSRIFKDVQYLIENEKRYGNFRQLFQKMRVYHTNIPGDQMVQVGRQVYNTAWASVFRTPSSGVVDLGSIQGGGHG